MPSRSISAPRPRLIRLLVIALLMELLMASGTLTVRHAAGHSPHDSIVHVAVSPDLAEDGLVYSISRTLLLRSTDGGDTWTELQSAVPSQRNLRYIAISTLDPDRVFVSGFSGLLRSTDGGASFDWIEDLNARVDIVSVAPWDDDIVLATRAVARELWRSDDGGDTWTRLPDIEGVTVITFVPDEPGRVLLGHDNGAIRQSSDSGITWSEASEVADEGRIMAISASPTYTTDRTFVVAAEQSGVLRTTDGGTTFTALGEGISDPVVMSVAVSPEFDQDMTMWASTYAEGVFVSQDGGETWTISSDGLTTNQQADLLDRNHFGGLAVAASAPGRAPTLFLEGFDGLFRSVDGAEQWEELDTQAPSIVMGLALPPEPVDHDVIILTTYLNGLFRSTDQGATWEPANEGLVSRYDWTRSPYYVNRLHPAFLSPTFEDDQTAFVISRGRIHRSTDAGTTWQTIIPDDAIVEGEFPPDYFFLGMSPEYASDRTILVGTDGGKVFISTDAGESYQRLMDLGLEVTSLVMSPETGTAADAFVGTPEGVYRTSDFGRSWEPTAWPEEAGPETSLAISPGFATDTTVFAGSPVGLWVTADAGDTWTSSGDETPVATGYIESVALSPAFDDDGTALASVRGAGLYRSQDGGATWQEIAPSLLADGVVFSNFYHATAEPIIFSPSYEQDGTIWGFDGQVTMRSMNGGDDWERIEVPLFEHDTAEEAAPGELGSVPRYEDVEGQPAAADGEFSGAGEPSPAATDAPATQPAPATTDAPVPTSEPQTPATTRPDRSLTTRLTGRRLTMVEALFAGTAAALMFVVLWLIERVSPRARLVLRVAVPVAVFVVLLWLFTR